MITIHENIRHLYLKKYINLVLGVKNVTVSRSYFQFRCNVCGDSKKNRSKRRGYILMQKKNWVFKCHNCGKSMSAEKWLKEYYPVVYKQYIVELLQNNSTDNQPIFSDRKSVV